MKPDPACALHVPEIQTERLRLRQHRMADLPAMVAMWGDPEVTRFLNTPPSSAEETWARYLRYRGHWCTLGYGYWAAEERSNGAFVGEAGFADYHRLVEPPTALAPEMGWVLARAHHGKGYATEMVSALLAWGREQFRALPLHCIINPEHEASLRVARKCGFVPARMLQYKGSPAVLMETPGLPLRRS